MKIVSGTRLKSKKINKDIFPVILIKKGKKGRKKFTSFWLSRKGIIKKNKIRIEREKVKVIEKEEDQLRLKGKCQE